MTCRVCNKPTLAPVITGSRTRMCPPCRDAYDRAVALEVARVFAGRGK